MGAPLHLWKDARPKKWLAFPLLFITNTTALSGHSPGLMGALVFLGALVFSGARGFRSNDARRRVVVTLLPVGV